MIKEACVETFAEARLAQQRGANRIELCSDLANDGLTPLLTLLKQCVEGLKIPVMTMIRPRTGNFVYTAKEVGEMKTEIDTAKKAGAAGIVLGLLTVDNKIDTRNTRVLAKWALPLPVTFHKAIDKTENPVDGVSELLKIDNIKRILTSGGKPTALEGAPTIRKMMAVAGDKITILVAGKVLDSNLEEVAGKTGATEFHGRRIVGEL